MEEAGGINLYQFVHNNPINDVDPNGLTGWSLNNPARWWDPNAPDLDPKCPGPDETDAAIALFLAALVTPVPGDEAVAGAVIVKRLESLLNKCKPCKNFRCSWKIIHPPHHWWPAPGNPNKKAFRWHIHIRCWDKSTGKELINKPFPFGHHYKQKGGHGGDTW